jgi:hypothetical protein
MKLPMNTRSLGVLLVTCLAWSTACAQEPGPDLTDLPGWIYTELTGDPEPKAAKSTTKPTAHQCVHRHMDAAR